MGTNKSRKAKPDGRTGIKNRPLDGNAVRGGNVGSKISQGNLRYLVVKNFICAYADKFKLRPDQAVYYIRAELEKFRHECKPKLPPRSGRKRVESVRPKTIRDNRLLMTGLKLAAGGLFLCAMVLTVVLLVS